MLVRAVIRDIKALEAKGVAGMPLNSTLQEIMPLLMLIWYLKAVKVPLCCWLLLKMNDFRFAFRLNQNIKSIGCFYKIFINSPESCIIIFGNTQICSVVDGNILGK